MLPVMLKKRAQIQARKESPEPLRALSSDFDVHFRFL